MGVIAPARMIRTRDYKYVDTHGHAAQLYDVNADPLEQANLAGSPETARVEAQLSRAVRADWDGDAVMADVLASQRRRLYLNEAARLTQPHPHWDFHATRDDSRRFVRAHGAAGAKALARFPFVPPPA
jgi:choline-sulfatase